jgi:hypothetical protein
MPWLGAFAAAHLDIAIMIDADCRLADAAVDRLATACAVTNRPVQARHLMNAPDGCPINYRVAEFAWRLKNWVRPLGPRALGLPCQLMGTGMAFPWDVIRSADLASCPFPGVTGEFPFSVEGGLTQRLRWERGHLGTILTAVPRLIFVAVGRADFNLLALAIDVAVSPLSLLGMLVIAMRMVACPVTSLGSSSVAMLVSTASLAGFVGFVVQVWSRRPAARCDLVDTFLCDHKTSLYRKLLSRKAGSYRSCRWTALPGPCSMGREWAAKLAPLPQELTPFR